MSEARIWNTSRFHLLKLEIYKALLRTSEHFRFNHFKLVLTNPRYVKQKMFPMLKSEKAKTL